MEADLAGTKDGISERFVPDQDRGRLIEVEHLSRYRWAAQTVAGRTVLDAGCGAGYGSRLLAEAGAREVVGVDIAGAVLEAIAPTMPDNVRLQTGDLRSLELDDDSVEVVVCFEVIEHFDEPMVVLDELVRVLAPGGLLLISSPNRGVYQPGNPHHRHEFRPDELEQALGTRLANVGLVRQHDYVVSALLSDETYAIGDGATVPDAAIHKQIAGTPGQEIYTVALASDGPLPELQQVLTMTGTLEMREWLTVFETQTQAITDKDNYITELEARVQESERLAELLAGAEQRLADVPNLRAQITDLEVQLAQERDYVAIARRQAQELDQVLMYGRRMLRHAQPLIGPLKRLRRLLRS